MNHLTDAHFAEAAARKEELAAAHYVPLVLECRNPGCVVELEYHLYHREVHWLHDLIGESGWTVFADGKVMCPTCSRGDGPIRTRHCWGRVAQSTLDTPGQG